MRPLNFFATLITIALIAGGHNLQASISLPIHPTCASALAAIKGMTASPAVVEATSANISGKPSKRLMIVFRTNGCYYDQTNTGCTMCDFKRHAIDPDLYRIRTPELMAQFETAIRQHASTMNEIEEIDLLTLGNFLHKSEIEESFWTAIMKRVSELSHLRKIVIESRAPFIKSENLHILRKALRSDVTLEVALGVETSNEDLRQIVLNKGLSDRDIRTALGEIGKLKDLNVEFQAYVLIKPQTLTEQEAVDDAVRSATDLVRLANEYGLRLRIAFEPVFVTRGTPLEIAYLKGQYTPPNLWTIIEVLKRTNDLLNRASNLTSIFVGLSDEGLSQNRMASSCAHCRDRIWNAIDSYNATQSLGLFKNLECECNPHHGEIKNGHFDKDTA